MPKLDSVVGAIRVPSANTESVAAQRSLGDVAQALAPTAGAATRMGTRARLIGALPTPQYPQNLNWASVGGEVRVRFDVDTLGRPVLSSFAAVGSPNPQLVEAVRKVIADTRFEPARSPWPESVGMVDRVELAFQFAPRGRPR
jgi:TonB family protein